MLIIYTGGSGPKILLQQVAHDSYFCTMGPNNFYKLQLELESICDFTSQ